MTKISDKMREWVDTCCVDCIDKDDCDELRAIADSVDDEMMELPRDRDGVPIHVGDTVWDVEDGMEFEVRSITLRAGIATKVNAFRDGCDAYVSPTYFTHTRPDSLERIADELDEQAGSITKDGYTWQEDAIHDLAERIRKLAKEGTR